MWWAFGRKGAAIMVHFLTADIENKDNVIFRYMFAEIFSDMASVRNFSVFTQYSADDKMIHCLIPWPIY